MTTTLDLLYHHWPQTPREGNPCEICNVDRIDFAQLLGQLNLARGVEVGTEYGEYAEVLATAIGSSFTHPLICVDPYLSYSDYREHKSQLKLDTIYAQARERLLPLGVKILRLTSVEAATHFENNSLDWVYLDGNHSLPYVIADLHAWVPKVRRGGIVSGHDYIRRNNSLRYQCHVVEAIHAWVQCYMVNPLFIVGAKNEESGIKRDAIRSWFFIKD